MRIIANSFVLRQFVRNTSKTLWQKILEILCFWVKKVEVVRTPTFVTVSPQEICDRVAAAPKSAWSPGFKDGIFLVQIPCDGIWTTLHRAVEGETGTHTFKARREGEDVVISMDPSGGQTQCQFVQVIVYSQATLEGDRTPGIDADFEIISINGSPIDEEVPQSPISMARNQLGLSGGTKVEYPADVWAKSTWFWSTWSY